jgi:hypothetical protein
MFAFVTLTGLFIPAAGVQGIFLPGNFPAVIQVRQRTCWFVAPAAPQMASQLRRDGFIEPRTSGEAYVPLRGLYRIEV